MVRANHTNISLQIWIVPNHHLSECLILEAKLKNKKGYLVSLYRFRDEFELFVTNLENLLAV